MINYQKMYLYKIHRSDELDHIFGRPAIFLAYFGQESLVWCGTTLKASNINNELPFILFINDNVTYFYNKGLTKIKTKYLVGKWRNNTDQKIISLTENQQQELIAKFSQLTLINNPFLEIKDLNQKLINMEQILTKVSQSYLKELNKNQKLNKKCLELEAKLKNKEEQNNGQQFNP